MTETDVPPAPLAWLKSTFSGDAGCVEVASLTEGFVALRDSKNPDKGYFVYNAHEWHSFLSGVRAGEFDDLV